MSVSLSTAMFDDLVDAVEDASSPVADEEERKDDEKGQTSAAFLWVRRFSQLRGRL